MSEKQSSVSAAGVALLRAVEAEKPEAERICYDPFAHSMIPGGLSFKLSKWMITSGLYEKMAPGATSFIVLRERFIDDFLKNELETDFDQVVILGAGFDTRAYRTVGIEKTRVFEVDDPATQRVKLERLKKVIDPIPSFVNLVPVDFNTESLFDVLRVNGYSEKGKTVFIWQGVTYFLKPEGVDNTLDFIAHHSSKGSVLIFDYFYTSTVHDSTRKDVQMLRRAAKISGEEYLFGIDEGQIEHFLAKKGFNEVHDFTFEDLKRLYFKGSNTKRVVPTGMGIVSCQVNNPIT